MKPAMKQFFLLAVSLFLAVAAFGQSLEGSWTGNQSLTKMDGDDMSTMDMDYTYTFTGNTFTIRQETSVDLGITDVPPFLVLASVSGDWTLEDGILTMAPSRRPKPSVEMKADGVPGLVRMFMADRVRKDIAKELRETRRYEVLILTDTALLLREIPSEKDLKDPDYEPGSLSFERK